MTDVSDEVLTKIKAALTTKTDRWGVSQDGVCQGDVFDLDGNVTAHGHSACHSWVSSAFRKATGRYNWGGDIYAEAAKPFIIATCHTPKYSYASKEATEAAILWLADEAKSPFAKFVLNRDDKTHLTTAGALIFGGPGGANHSQAMWMCKFLRYSTEGSKALDVWHILYRNGVNPLLAAYICTHISSYKGATFTASSVSAHVGVFRDEGGPYLEEVPVDLHGLMKFSFNKGADSTHNLFKDNDAKTKAKGKPLARIAELCKPYVKDDGWGGKITGKGCDEKQLVEGALKWQEELGGYDAGISSCSEVPVIIPVAEPAKNTVFLDFDL